MRRAFLVLLAALGPVLTSRAQPGPALCPSTPEAAVRLYVRAVAMRDGAALMAAADSGAVNRFLRLMARPEAQRALPDSLRGLSGAPLLSALLRSTNEEVTASLVGVAGWIDPDSLRIDVLGSVPDGAHRAFVVARLQGLSRAVATNTAMLDAVAGRAATRDDPRLFGVRRRADGVWMADFPPLVYRMLEQSDGSADVPRQRQP